MTDDPISAGFTELERIKVAGRTLFAGDELNLHVTFDTTQLLRLNWSEEELARVRLRPETPEEWVDLILFLRTKVYGGIDA